MTLDPARFGRDLRLLDDLEVQIERRRGTDLRVAPRPEAPGDTDLEAVEGVRNLQQALLLRFLTHVGELAAFGHPDYGSRLHELIGEPNTQTNRDRVKLFALQALSAEPRVREVVRLDVTTDPTRRSRVDVRATLAVLDEDTALNLVVPFDFDGGAP